MLPRTAAEPAGYVDAQTGYLLVGSLAATILATLAWTWVAGPHLARTLLLLPQLWSIACFSTLRIRVTEERLTWLFGPGWIRGEVGLADIVTTHIVMAPFAYGWGFRRSVRGWRFHRGGALALEIHCRGGRRVRLGTARAHQLQLLIESIRGRRHRLP